MSSQFDASRWSGKIRKVLMICRSSCQSSYQTEAGHEQHSAEGDQETYLREWLHKNMTGEVEVRVVKISKEEHSDKAAIEQALDALREHSCDLLLVASLDRINRGLDVLRFLTVAAEQKMRVVAAADGVDTSEANWCIAAILAAMCDGWATADAAGRIRRHCQ